MRSSPRLNNFSTSTKLSNNHKTLHEKKSEGFKVELSTEQIAVQMEIIVRREIILDEEIYRKTVGRFSLKEHGP